MNGLWPARDVGTVGEWQLLVSEETMQGILVGEPTARLGRIRAGMAACPWVKGGQIAIVRICRRHRGDAAAPSLAS